ncbi:MAG TPA: multidrug efflux RND transporter permease subunit [Terracidiphilus sp.]|nr:multidrug efflux RND transporter permease subunit [Terracidiphilus sp.]
MHLSAPFIRRPVATSLLSLALLLAGSVAYSVLPVASLPDVDYPVIGVNAGLPGASPETMASAVATPLERQFGRIAGVNQMTSTSSLGSASVVLQFDLNRNIDNAARDVQAAINAARGQLPSYLPQNPGYRKANPADAPILILTLTSDVVPKPQIYDMANSVLAQRISQVSGIGQVYVGGSASPAVRVELNPLQLANTGIGLEAIRTALSSANANRPKGSFQDATHRWMITDNDQIFKAAEYAPIIAGYNHATGAPVRIGDVGTLTDSIADTHTDGVVGVNPDVGPHSKLRSAVMLIVFKSPGANVIDAVNAVMRELPQLRADIPPAIQLSVVADRTTSIRQGVHDVEISLMVSVLLVVLVVFLFLREAWATIIPSVAVPLSLVGTFGVMYVLGYTIDNLSLMALTISTGFVVDDAIVVIENITRYLEEGMQPFDAAMKGSKEIGFTVLSMSTSLIAVFLPILLMGGLVGKLFREFAVTLSVAIAMSLLVSLTTTPMLCAKFLRPRDAVKHGRAYLASERMFRWLHEEYALGLRWVLRHQWLTLSVLLGTVLLNVYLFVVVPKGLFPQQDTGRLGGQTMAAQDISFDAMRAKQRTLAQMVLDDPAVSTLVAFSGGGSVNVGRMFINLKEPQYRKGVTSDMVVNRLRRKLSSVPGARLFLQTQQDIHMGGRGSSAQYQYTLSDPNVDELNHWAPQLEARLQTLPQLRDVSSDQQDQGLAANLVIDRDTASRLGVSMAAIDQTLYDAFGQRQVSTMYTGLNQYFVVMEVDPKYQQSPDALKGIYIKSSTGKMVPLSTLAHYESQRTALAVNHQGQYPAITLTFNLAPNVSLGAAVTALQQAQRELGMPSAVRASFQGTAQVFQESLHSELYLIGAALLAVYIVLGILYESLIHPLTILSTLPPAGVGAFLALMLTGNDLTIIAMIGIILLIGIVKKNAILMIDFALQAERDQGLPPVEAIYQACLLRFRPIMMTTMAALFGGLPLAIGMGAGSELRTPLGITIVGGLIVSQMLTLFTTPVVYLLFDRLQWKVMKLHRIGSELESSHGD